MQTTSHLLMIRPVNFSFNAETAVNNAFQQKADDDAAGQKALEEFNAFADLLKTNGVDVTIVQDTPEPYTPDSIFPNNWVSFHADGTMVLYPMFAVNRRAERSPAVIEKIADRFDIKKTINLSGSEADNAFLEGTGSMVLDRDKHFAYACLSPRTDAAVLEDFCKKMQYTPVVFNAADGNGHPIYHTNVMMCVADKYVVICLESITNPEEAQKLETTIRSSGKTIVPISLKQMNQFAGNMLQVENNKKEKLLVMSSQAYTSLNEDQLATLESFNRIIHSPLDTIETNGGGSARCMLAEIHLPVKN